MTTYADQLYYAGVGIGDADDAGDYVRISVHVVAECARGFYVNDKPQRRGSHFLEHKHMGVFSQQEGGQASIEVDHEWLLARGLTHWIEQESDYDDGPRFFDDDGEEDFSIDPAVEAEQAASICISSGLATTSATLALPWCVPRSTTVGPILTSGESGPSRLRPSKSWSAPMLKSLRTLKFFRQRAAIATGVFFEDRDFWPAYYPYVGKKLGGHIVHVDAISKAKVGDVVDLLVTPDGRIHRYRVLGWAWAAGDDHVISPKHYHLQFWETRAIDPAEIRIARVKHWSDDVTTVFDQFGRHMPEFEGKTEDVLPKILAAGWSDPYVHRISKSWRKEEEAA